MGIIVILENDEYKIEYSADTPVLVTDVVKVLLGQEKLIIANTF